MTEQLKQAAQQSRKHATVLSDGEVRHYATCCVTTEGAIRAAEQKVLERALTTSQPGARHEATTQAQDDSSSDAQVDQGRLRDADSRVGAQVPALTHPAQAGEVDERVAFIEWLETTWPRCYPEGTGADYWRNGHLAALAWKAARASLPTQPAAQATPDDGFAVISYRTNDISLEPTEAFKAINCQVNGIDGTAEARRVDDNTVDIGRVVAFAQATPEPVGEVVAWWHVDKSGGLHAFTSEPPPSLKAKCRPLVFGDTHPAPGVPEDVADLLCSVADNLNDMPISDEYASKTAKKAYDLLVKHGAITTPADHIAAAQAKGADK